MPDSFEGKIALAKLEQKITDHVDSNARDFSEIKGSLTRIETKLDVKADKDSVESINSVIAAKANSEEVKNKANKWVETFAMGLIITIVTAAIGIVVYLVEKHIL